ncbi:Phage integrase, N-terminal SAM-like domain [Streptoalloteichus tenebrarius]|uniref:Phage integrase, N-terminal SAM-like domain n=1 Tax=Streptoalloteichus tenebrarius (strain ATCC 17920 / DSM 40477 / JCM 4838 / CBS 697.72 / NBRC 16177 / NCIMB 11028 / NRRL B-12390 / A12253. 1 / ISP 5477) TaxID=1933 RepID=A0ABT1HR18_STRSD|nr:tyrosine-type recombinase/integrase [Streptoalloteichus tenebrarius]MCP2257966.1 Phage integrase, N-terminal SAM-like domain [Streptoalloteichus tenebrarius]BFF01631.1 site-specific integrase [Streptoalloteichus tenebrarius]
MGEKRSRKPNGRSSIYLGSDGLWHGYVTMGVKPDGSPDRRHVKRKTEKAATDAVRQLEQQRDAGKVRKAGRAPTVAEWMATYLDTIAAQKLAPRTLDDYWSKTRNWIIPCIGEHRLNRLAPEHLDHLYAQMYKAKKAPSHVLKVHRILSRALKIAMRRGKIGQNVCDLVDPPTVDRQDADRLHRDEAKKVLGVAERRRNGARWSVALACGLRQGEALGLRWEFVDLKTGDVRVWWQLQRNTWKHGCDDPHACGERFHKKACPKRCTKHKAGCPRPCPPKCERHAHKCPKRQGGGMVFRRPKGKSRRTVTLPPPLLAKLCEHKIRQDVERQAAGSDWEDWDLVFCQPNGRPIDPKDDWEEWGHLLEEAGVRYVRVHDGRHTAGTLLVEQGVHMRVIQMILGHSDVRTTELYTVASNETTRDAAARMGSALWDS